MSTPKVSVIIPIYNTELYVKDAILSITNQTLKEIEIILINDGSTDNSSQIIELLACSDDRIQLYNQENQGQSVARNLGISKATGKYLYFMDSDDLLELDALECCYNKCDADELDFVFFDADIISDNDELHLAFDYIRPEIEEHTYKGIELLEKLIDKDLYRAAPWMSFIRRSYLQDISLLFYPRIIHEDELFTTILYAEAKRVGRINRRFFKRRLRGNSTMTKQYSWKNVIGYMTVFDELTKYYKLNPQSKSIITKLLSTTINPFVYSARNLSFKERIKLYRFIRRGHYLSYIAIKNLVILLFPQTVGLKKALRKIHHSFIDF